MSSSTPRSAAAKQEHFSSSVLKKLEDGTEVISSYVDEEAGDELLAGVSASSKVEAASGNEEETEKALEDASETMDESAKPKQVADEKAVEKEKETRAEATAKKREEREKNS